MDRKLEKLLNYREDDVNYNISKRTKTSGKVENVLTNYYYNKHR